jgi:radical SAM superfamily enzyme YgiQ (UPF0313 family)
VGKNPSIIEKHRGFNPPLGLLYVASTIRKSTDYKIEVLDTQPFNWTYSQLEEQLQGNSFDVVGISAMTFTLIDTVKTARLVKKVMPKAKVVLGGAHIHLFPEETINLEGVDFALMGEAELSFMEFLRALGNDISLNKVPGLIYRNGNGRIQKNCFYPLKNLDEIPFPERKFLNVKLYNSLLSRGSLSTTIISSRGCPFHCAFCDRPFSPITSHFRYRSTKNIIEEISECLELGIKDFLFYDDTFTIGRERVLEFCEEIINRNFDIRWDIRTRVDLVDAEMLRVLKKSGCVAVHYGVEAGNDRILKVIKKGFTVKKVKEIFKMTRELKIETLAYFMIGLPSEYVQDIQDTFDLAKELKPEYAHFTIFSPYPGTELYYLGLERGIIKKDIWKEFARNPEEGFKVPVWEENFNRDQLYKMIVKFYKSFYLRPFYVISRGFKVRSKDEFVRKAKAGLSVLFMKKKKIDSMK